MSIDYYLVKGFGRRFRSYFVVRSNTDDEKELKELLKITKKHGSFDKFPHDEQPEEPEEKGEEMGMIEVICEYSDVLFYSEPTEDRQETRFIEKYGISNKYDPEIFTIEDNINKMRKKLKKENREKLQALQESLKRTNIPTDLEGVIGSFVEENQ